MILRVLLLLVRREPQRGWPCNGDKLDISGTIDATLYFGDCPAAAAKMKRLRLWR